MMAFILYCSCDKGKKRIARLSKVQNFMRNFRQKHTSFNLPVSTSKSVYNRAYHDFGERKCLALLSLNAMNTIYLRTKAFTAATITYLIFFNHLQLTVQIQPLLQLFQEYTLIFKIFFNDRPTLKQMACIQFSTSR